MWLLVLTQFCWFRVQDARRLRLSGIGSSSTSGHRVINHIRPRGLQAHHRCLRTFHLESSILPRAPRPASWPPQEARAAAHVPGLGCAECSNPQIVRDAIETHNADLTGRQLLHFAASLSRHKQWARGAARWAREAHRGLATAA